MSVLQRLFGGLSGILQGAPAEGPPQAPVESAQQPTKINQILQNPALTQALFRLSSAVGEAQQQGMGIGAGLGAGGQAFMSTIQEADALRAKAKQEAIREEIELAKLQAQTGEIRSKMQERQLLRQEALRLAETPEEMTFAMANPQEFIKHKFPADTGTMREFEMFRNASPEVQEQMREFFDARRAGGTTVNVGDSAFGSGDLTGQQAVGRKERISQLQSGLDAITKLEQEIAENPADFGAMGSVRGSVQTGLGILGDLNVPGGKAITDRATSLVSSDDELVSRLAPIQNKLAIGIARARQPEDRLLKDILTSAEGDVKLTGMASSEQVRQRLGQLRQELESALQQQRVITEEAGVETGTTRRVKPPAAAVEALLANPELADQFDAKYGDGAANILLREQQRATGGR